MIDLTRYGYQPPDPNADLSTTFGENHPTVAGAGKGAMNGAMFGGAGAGVGALIGGIASRSNSTKNAREDFAHSIGAANTTDLWARLHQALSPDAADELQNRALTRIGKHDTTANQQWMQDVQAALNAGGAQQTAPAAPVQAAAPVDPKRQAVLDALQGGGNYRDALVRYLRGGGS